MLIQQDLTCTGKNQVLNETFTKRLVIEICFRLSVFEKCVNLVNLQLHIQVNLQLLFQRWIVQITLPQQPI